jgi:hypothetical protein
LSGPFLVGSLTSVKYKPDYYKRQKEPTGKLRNTTFGKPRELTADVFDSKAVEADRFRLKLSYHDESLRQLKDRYRGLTLLNELLKVEEFLRESP